MPERIASITKSSPRSGLGKRSRLFYPLLALFAGSIIAFVFFVLLPNMKERQYASADLPALLKMCDQKDPRACIEYGKRLINLRKPQDAIKPLTECWNYLSARSESTSNSLKAELGGTLALALQLSTETAQSPKYFKTAIQLDYNSATAHLAFAFWLQANRADKMAMDEANVATLLEPENHLAWFLKAHLHNQTMESEAARAAAKKAIALKPDAANYWQEMGDSYGFSGQYVDSLPYYRKELELAPDSVGAQSDVARALAFAAQTPNEYEEAKTRVEEVLLRKIVDEGPGYALLGELHLRFNKFVEARKALEKALALDDTVPQTYYNLAQARRLTGDLAGSETALAKYKELELHFRQARTLQKRLSERSDDPELHLALAKEWEYYHAWADALQEYQAVLALTPNHPFALARTKALAKYADRVKNTVPTSWGMARLLNANAALTLNAPKSNTPPPSSPTK